MCVLPVLRLSLAPVHACTRNPLNQPSLTSHPSPCWPAAQHVFPPDYAPSLSFLGLPWMSAPLPQMELLVCTWLLFQRPAAPSCRTATAARRDVARRIAAGNNEGPRFPACSLLQARWVACALSGAAPLPPRAKMEAAAAAFYAGLDAAGVPKRWTHRQAGEERGEVVAGWLWVGGAKRVCGCERVGQQTGAVGFVLWRRRSACCAYRVAEGERPFSPLRTKSLLPTARLATSSDGTMQRWWRPQATRRPLPGCTSCTRPRGRRARCTGSVSSATRRCRGRRRRWRRRRRMRQPPCRLCTDCDASVIYCFAAVESLRLDSAAGEEPAEVKRLVCSGHRRMRATRGPTHQTSCHPGFAFPSARHSAPPTGAQPRGQWPQREFSSAWDCHGQPAIASAPSATPHQRSGAALLLLILRLHPSSPTWRCRCWASSTSPPLGWARSLSSSSSPWAPCWALCAGGTSALPSAMTCRERE